MTEENYEDVLANKGMPVPNVWIELEGEFCLLYTSDAADDA